MNKVICPNCGAAIYENEPKCPFCGYINITGAEEQFMRDVQKTEDELSQIPEMQKKHLKKTLSKNSRIIFVTITIVTVLIAVVFGFHFLVDNVLFRDEKTDFKAVMQWERQNYPVLDELYQEGNYDEIIAFEYALYEENSENETDYSLINWEHYNFINVYRNYADFEKGIALLDQDKELSEYDAKELVYNGLWFYYQLYDKSYYEYAEEEMFQIEAYREQVLADLFGRLGFTEEEILSIEDNILKDGYLESKVCWKYAKKIMDRFQ